MKQSRFAGSLMLLLAALIWGTAFVAQRVGMDFAGPLTFNGVRSLIGAAVLVPLFLLLKPKENVNYRKTALGGLLCGLLIFAATNLQQAGILYTEVGKAGFITTFYLILVPLFGLFLRRRIGPLTWVAVVLSLAGLYFLCMTPGSFSLQKGDFLVLGCAFFFAVQIMVIDHFVQDVNGIMMNSIQFGVSGLLSLLAAFVFEKPQFSLLFREGWVPLLYTGVLSCGIAYSLQILGQKRLHPAVAAIMMSLESVFAVLGGWLILHQKLSGRELLGCGLMLCAVLLVQLVPASPPKTKQ